MSPEVRSDSTWVALVFISMLRVRINISDSAILLEVHVDLGISNHFSSRSLRIRRIEIISLSVLTYIYACINCFSLLLEAPLC